MVLHTSQLQFFSLPFLFSFLFLLFMCFVYVVVAIICIQALLRVILCGSWRITCSTMVKSNLLMRTNLCIICEKGKTDISFVYMWILNMPLIIHYEHQKNLMEKRVAELNLKLYFEKQTSVQIFSSVPFLFQFHWITEISWF